MKRLRGSKNLNQFFEAGTARTENCQVHYSEFLGAMVSSRIAMPLGSMARCGFIEIFRFHEDKPPKFHGKMSLILLYERMILLGEQKGIPHFQKILLLKKLYKFREIIKSSLRKHDACGLGTFRSFHVCACDGQVVLPISCQKTLRCLFWGLTAALVTLVGPKKWPRHHPLLNG
jgi:hypothetical protein